MVMCVAAAVPPGWLGAFEKATLEPAPGLTLCKNGKPTSGSTQTQTGH